MKTRMEAVTRCWLRAQRAMGRVRKFDLDRKMLTLVPLLSLGLAAFTLLSFAVFSTTKVEHQNDFCKIYRWAEYGASNGAGMQWIQAHLGIEPIGIDFDTKKVRNCISNGFNCVEADFLHPPFKRNCFAGISLCHVLEHLPNRSMGIDVISAALQASKCLVWFRGPLWNTKRLSNLDMSIYYSLWTGHTSFFDLTDIEKGIQSAEGTSQISAEIFAASPIHTSEDSKILPRCNREDCVNKHEYNETMGTKRAVEFEPPMFSELIAIMKKSNCSDSDEEVYHSLLSYIFDTLIPKKGAILVGYYENNALHRTENFDVNMVEE